MVGSALGGPRHPPDLAQVGEGTPGSGNAGPERLVLTSFERSLWQVGLSELESAISALTADVLGDWFISDPGIEELGLIRTCHRFAVFAVTRGNGPAERLGERLAPYGKWELRDDRGSIHHLFRVAAGLESIAPGELEIREQVRLAASTTLSRHPRPLLRTLFRRASETAGTLGVDEAPSVADLAVEWLRPRLSGPRARVMVIGAGVVGRRVAEKLSGSAEVVVCFRHTPPDPRWADRWNVRTVPAHSLRAELRATEAVVAAAKTTGRVLSMEDLPPVTAGAPRLLVDLGVPRNIDPGISARPGTELIDLEHLPRGNVVSQRLERIEQAAREGAAGAYREFCQSAVEPWVSWLRQTAERVRVEELDRALAHAGPLTDASRHALELLSERLVRRILSGPTERLRAIPPAPEADEQRRRLVELFRTHDDKP